MLSTSAMVAVPNKAGPGSRNNATICSIPINICRLTLTSSVNMHVILGRTGPAKKWHLFLFWRMLMGVCTQESHELTSLCQ